MVIKIKIDINWQNIKVTIVKYNFNFYKKLFQMDYGGIIYLKKLEIF